MSAPLLPVFVKLERRNESQIPCRNHRMHWTPDRRRLLYPRRR